MSQLTEREQGQNTDEGKSGSAKDLSDDQDMESPSNAGSRCEDQTEPCSGDLSKYMQDGKEDIVNIKEINEEQRKMISELEDKVNEVIKKQEKRIAELEKAECNLWLYCLPEQEGEDVRKRVMDILGALVPEAAGNLTHHIGIVQRIGRRSQDRDRPVIIKFSDKSTKELLWNTANRSEDFRSSNLWFGEDLTAKDKEKRNKLWPQVEAARKEGKTAYFVGAKAIIDGKEISE